jgi:hypothetical protein
MGERTHDDECFICAGGDEVLGRECDGADAVQMAAELLQRRKRDRRKDVNPPVPPSAHDSPNQGAKANVPDVVEANHKRFYTPSSALLQYNRLIAAPQGTTHLPPPESRCS